MAESRVVKASRSGGEACETMLRSRAFQKVLAAFFGDVSRETL
jgi:hypothetical protein